MSATGSVRVMLVEDHTAFRQALAFLLDQEPGIEVVAQSGSLAEAREALIAEGRLDVAVLDLRPRGKASGARRVSVLRSRTVRSGTSENAATAGCIDTDLPVGGCYFGQS